MNTSDNRQLINELLSGLRNESSSMEGRLVSEYLPRLTKLASKLMRGFSSASEDEEDIAQSALKSFMLRVRNGHVFELDSHEALWALLAEMARHKALNRIRAEDTAKRGGRRVANETDVGRSGNDQSPLEVASLGIGHQDLDLACEELLDALPNDELRQISLLLFQGYKQREIADLFGRESSAIQRKVAIIRDIWRRFLDTSMDKLDK